MINVGIIGTGVMGAGHARFIKEHVPNATVVGLSDVDLNKVTELSKELGTVIFSTTNPEELMKDPRVNAVIIASPDPLHVPHLRLAIASGKQILCEKPIATTLEDAKIISEEIRTYESQVGKKMINFGFMRRFDPCYQEVRRLIASGDFGAPTFFRTVTRNVSSTGATSTGLFTNIAIHDFDIYRWLFNDEWESIQSFYPRRSSLSPEGLADPLIIIGKLKSGVTMIADIVAFNNYGFESRLLHNYNFLNKKSIFLFGLKYYKSNNTSVQGPGTDGYGSNFDFQYQDYPYYNNQSNYKYPNQNISLFTENIF